MKNHDEGRDFCSSFDMTVSVSDHCTESTLKKTFSTTKQASVSNTSIYNAMLMSKLIQSMDLSRQKEVSMRYVTIATLAL